MEKFYTEDSRKNIWIIYRINFRLKVRYVRYIFADMYEYILTYITNKFWIYVRTDYICYRY